MFQLKLNVTFLSGRGQRVKIDVSFSDWREILSGVPQGSVLGPLLFLIYINDLPEAVMSCVKLFADDTKVYRPISSQQDQIALNQDLQSLMDWSHTWELTFNQNKCGVLHLGVSYDPFHYTFSSCGISQVLQNLDEEKDLGIIIDEHLDFSTHINAIVSKANRQLGLIQRSFIIRDRSSMLLLYNSTVRPILEYGSPVWSPWKKKQIIHIENVQRRLTRLIHAMEGLTYEQRLKALDLPTLQFRRKRECLIQTYKLLHGLYDTDYKVFFKRVENNVTRGHSWKLQSTRARLNQRGSFFSVAVVGHWNQLPEAVVSAGTLNQFKTRLQRHMHAGQFVLV